MPRIDCFGKHGFKELGSKFSDLVKGGMSEGEAARTAITDYHKQLHDDLNNLKKSIGVKQSDYAASDNSEQIKKINDEYDSKVKNFNHEKPRIRVSAKEVRDAQPGIIDENGKISYEKFKNELLDTAANVKDNSLDFRLTIPGLDQKGIEQAVRNIREGKKTKAAETFENAVKEMHENGVVSINRGRGDHTEAYDVPIKDWLESSKESRDMADKFDEDATRIINESGITEDNIDSLKHLFDGFPYTEDDFHAVKAFLRGEAESREQAERDREESAKKPKSKEKIVEETKPQISEAATKMADELSSLLGNLPLKANESNKIITLKDLGIKDGDNIKDALDKLIAHGGEFTNLFKYLRGLPEIDQLKLEITNKLRYREGEYVPASNLAEPEENRKTVRISKNVEDAPYAFIHEIGHYLTLDSEIVNKYGDKKKIATLQDIYNYLKKNNPDTRQYGFANFTEFLAELPINSDLRKEVGNIVASEKEFNDALGKSKSVLEYIHDFIKDLIEKLFGKSTTKDIDFSKPLIENAAKLYTDIYFSGQQLIPEETKAWKALGIQQIGEKSQYENAALENPGLENNKRQIISNFVKDKLAAGQSESDIKAALVANGLTVKEAESFFAKPIRVSTNPNAKPEAILDDYELTQSGKINDFISGKTIEDVFGEGPDGNQSYAVQTLSDMLQDGRNMIARAQTLWGGDISQYGQPLLNYIQNMGNDAALGNKKAVLLATFLGEIKEEIIRNPAVRPWLSPVESQVEDYYQRFMNQRGKELAAGRLLRLFRDKYLGDVFADKILDEQQRKQKSAIQNALGKKVDDSVAANPSKKTVGSDQIDTAKDKAKQAKKPSLKADDAKQIAENKLKDIEQRMGSKDSMVDKIKEAIKKINCK